MKIWIITTGEPVPFIEDEKNDRFLRAGKLAQRMAKSGHDVLWITSQFDHYGKRIRDVPENVEISTGDGLPNLLFLKSNGYKSHISFSRFFDHWQLGKAFKLAVSNMEKPDIVLCAYPLIELCDQSIQYGKLVKVPVVVDIRDLWPDIFYNLLREKIGISFSGMMLPYERAARRIFKNADAVIGIVPGFLDWCHNRFPRDLSKSNNDRVFYQFKEDSDVARDEKYHQDFWKNKGVDLTDDKLKFVWVGSIVKTLDGDTLLEAVQTIPENIRDKIQIIICGVGDLSKKVEDLSKHSQHICYAGWVNADQLSVLLDNSHVGLLCYPDRFDFHHSIPNKVLDYLAADMKILTNLNGEIQRLKNIEDVLHSYQYGNPEDLRDKIVALANDRQNVKNKNSRARRIFDENFRADKVVSEMESFFKTIISRSDSAG